MTLAATRRGNGPALVVLQHFVGAELWRPVVDRLAAEHEIVSLDLPGFGASPLPRPATLAPREIAGHVATWFAEAGLDRPDVVGISYAGAVAVELARAGAAGRATAISPLGFWTAAEAVLVVGSVGLMVGSARAPWTRPIMASRLGPRLAGVSLVARPSRLPRAAIAAMTRAAAANRLVLHPELVRGLVAYRAEPFETAGRVTFAWGDRDRITTPSHARRAEQLFPTARHVTLAGCGHVPTFDDPEKVVEAILARRTAPSAGPGSR